MGRFLVSIEDVASDTVWRRLRRVGCLGSTGLITGVGTDRDVASGVCGGDLVGLASRADALR